MHSSPLIRSLSKDLHVHSFAHDVEVIVDTTIDTNYRKGAPKKHHNGETQASFIGPVIPEQSVQTHTYNSNQEDNQAPIQMCTQYNEEQESSEDPEPTTERIKDSEVDGRILQGDDGGSNETEVDVREESIEISIDPSALQVTAYVSTKQNSTQVKTDGSNNNRKNSELKDSHSGQAVDSSNNETITELKDLTLTSPRAVACVDLSTGIEVQMNPIQKQDKRGNNVQVKKYPSPGKVHRKKRHSAYQHDIPIPRVISFVPTLDSSLSKTLSNDLGHLYQIAPKSSDKHAHQKEKERDQASIHKKSARNNKSAPVYERLYNGSRERQNEGRRRRMEIAQRRK